MNNNIYFIKNKGIYVLKNNTTALTKTNGIQGIAQNIGIDDDRKVYISTNYGLYILNQGQNNTIIQKTFAQLLRSTSNAYMARHPQTPEKILGFDTKNNFYFTVLNNGAYVLLKGESDAKKIDNITGPVLSMRSNKNKVYFAGLNGAFVLNPVEKTIATKINITDSNPNVQYISFNNNKTEAYIVCATNTYILNLDNNTIETLKFDSHLFQDDNKDHIYLGYRQNVLYKVNKSTKRYEKIQVASNSNNQLFNSAKIHDIYFMYNQIYFTNSMQGETRSDFYVMNTEHSDQKLEQNAIHWWS